MRMNPLLAKELRLRMRNWRSFGTVALYLLILGGFGTLFFYTSTTYVNFYYMDLSHLGQNVFYSLAALQFALLFFLVPGFTATLISSEHERQTFDLLVCTRLTPFGIVLGKLASALSVVFLLILASLPLYGFAFLLGGVSPVELLILIAILMLTATIHGSFAIALSSIFRKTQAAVISSYGVSFFLLVGTIIIAGMLSSIFYYSSYYILLLVNPLALFEWLWPEMAREILGSFGRHHPWTWTTGLLFWQLSLIINLGLAALCLFIATRRVNPLRSGKYSG